jgi:hypothetical protein
VGDPRERVSPPDARHPLSEDRSLNERSAPERGCYSRMALAEVAQGLVLDKTNSGRCDRTQAVVQNPEMQALKVGNVTGNVKSQDLALALNGDLVAAREAVQHHAAAGWTVLFAHDVLIRPEIGDLYRQAYERASLLIGKRKDAVELADERVYVEGRMGVHNSLP